MRKQFDIYNNSRDLNHLKNTQKTPEQHSAEAWNLGIRDNSHIVHCTQTAGCDHVKVQNILDGLNNITCSTECKSRRAAIHYTVEKWFFSCSIIVDKLSISKNKYNNNNNNNNIGLQICAIAI